MAKEKVMQIMARHGLYVRDMGGNRIGLADNAGNIYDIVSWDGQYITEDTGLSTTLRDWLGY